MAVEGRPRTPFNLNQKRGMVKPLLLPPIYGK